MIDISFFRYLILLLLVGSLIPLISTQASYEPTVLFQNAQNFVKGKQYENAINELNMILENDPTNIDALNEKGSIRLIQGKYVKSLQNSEKSLEIEPILVSSPLYGSV